MADLAPVVSLASTKGGVGKTTLAFSLACEFAHRLAGAPAHRYDGGPDSRHAGMPDNPEGRQLVEVIDADPNATAAGCIRLGQPPGVGAETADADTLLEALAAARRRSRLVVVDLEGTANQAMLYAAAKSRLVLVPAQPSRFDVLEALKTMRVVKQAADIAERPIEARVVLTRAPVLHQTVTGHVLAQFEKRGLPMLATQLLERAAFRKLTFTGRPVWEVDAKGREGGAALNISAIADEITPLLGLPSAPALLEETV